MRIQSIYKVPKGKLIKISADIDKETESIQSIKIRGDFFAYPEESIEKLEQALSKKRFTNDEVFETISKFIDIHHVQFIGLDAQSLTDAIMRGKK